jgi:hypothetical protein
MVFTENMRIRIERLQPGASEVLEPDELERRLDDARNHVLTDCLRRVLIPNLGRATRTEKCRAGLQRLLEMHLSTESLFPAPPRIELPNITFREFSDIHYEEYSNSFLIGYDPITSDKEGAVRAYGGPGKILTYLMNHPGQYFDFNHLAQVAGWSQTYDKKAALERLMGQLQRSRHVSIETSRGENGVLQYVLNIKPVTVNIGDVKYTRTNRSAWYYIGQPVCRKFKACSAEGRAFGFLLHNFNHMIGMERIQEITESPREDIPKLMRRLRNKIGFSRDMELHVIDMPSISEQDYVLRGRGRHTPKIRY